MSKQFYIKQFILAYVQFQCLKQSYIKQFSLAYKNSYISSNSVWNKYAVSMSKQFYFKQLSLQIRSIWPIDRTLSGATIPDQKEYSALTKAPPLNEPKHHIV